MKTSSGRPARQGWLAGSIALSLIACGGGPHASRDLRAQLAADEAAALRVSAPDLVAEVERALDEADRAEGDNQPDAADDHVTRARLLLEAAQAEAARIVDERDRRELEERIATIVAQARRDEAAREEVSVALSRAASARTAREEAMRALAAAETDETRGGRRRRVTLEEPQDVRRGAVALRERAEALVAAARALGASETDRADAEAAVAASSAASDPLEMLRHADSAHRAAMRALGAARASAEGPGRDGPRVLGEAATEAGFEPLSLETGVAVEAPGLFSGEGVSLSASGRARLARLATLIHAFPHGPVQIQVQVRRLGSAGERLATQRAEALVRALVAAGVAEDRLEARGLSSALAGDEPIDASRAVFVAYAP